jgi:hypothetical protein
MSDIELYAGTAPPTILSSSVLSQRVKPRHAALAAQSETKQLKKQAARRQLRQQERRRLPMTQQDFYTKLAR